MPTKAKTQGRDQISARERPILAGLFLSKYDSLGLNKMGFSTFAEAFNVFGYALGASPSSIKNYRDEFDPLFSNARKGWHKRATRDYCLAVYEKYNGLGIDEFTALVRSLILGRAEQILVDEAVEPELGESAFAQRLLTGIAAENYFESVWQSVPAFSNYSLENATRFGCGYDFRLHPTAGSDAFLAVEVKGIRGQSGSVMMTAKEFDVASKLRQRFFLFVASNFDHSPSHKLYCNPTSSELQFKKVERVTVQTTWLTNV